MTQPIENGTVSRRYLVLDARRPYRIACGIVALPAIASSVIPLLLDGPILERLVWSAVCLAVGLLFGAVALRGSVSIPLGTTTTPADADRV